MTKHLKSIDLIQEFKGLDANDKFKKYRELWKQAECYKILTNFPLHLDIELAGMCNLKCKHCFQNGLITQPLGLMEYNLFKKIIDKAVPRGLCACKLQIRGESFLHPKLFDCINYAKSTGVLDVQITTNGTLLDNECIKGVLNSGLDAIILSVDSHHEENFQRGHGNNDYSDIEQNIQKLLKRRVQKGGSRPWVRLQTCIPTADLELYKKTKRYIQNKFPLADLHVINRMRNFREDEDCYPDLQTNYKILPCSYLLQRLDVHWNGDVTTCCSDYNCRFCLGNIKKQPIQNLWLSEKMNHFREIHRSGNRKLMQICKHCQVCTESLINKDQSHTKSQHIVDYGKNFSYSSIKTGI